MELDQMDNFKRFQKLFDQVGLPLLRSIFVCRFIHSNDIVKGSEEWKSNRDFGSRLLEMIKKQSSQSSQTSQLNHNNNDGTEIDNVAKKTGASTSSSNRTPAAAAANESEIYLSEAQKRLISTGYVHKFDFNLLCILLTKLQFTNNNNTNGNDNDNDNQNDGRLPKQFQVEQMQKWCMENRKIEQLASIYQHLSEVYGAVEKVPTTLFCPMWSMARSALSNLGANLKEMNDIWAMSFNKPLSHSPTSNGPRKSVIPSHVSEEGGGGGRVRSSSFGPSSAPNSNPGWPRKSVIPPHVSEYRGRARSNSIGSASSSLSSPPSPSSFSSSGHNLYPNPNQNWPRKSVIPAHVSADGDGGQRIRSNSFGSSSVPPSRSRSRRASTSSTDYYYISPTNNLIEEEAIRSPVDGKNSKPVTAPDANSLLATACSKLSLSSSNREQERAKSPLIRYPSICNNYNENSPLISSSSNLTRGDEDQTNHRFSIEKISVSCSVPILLHGISLVIVSSLFWIYSSGSHRHGANMYISLIGICLGIFRILYCIPCILTRGKNSKNHLIYIGLAHLGTGILLCLTLIAFLLTDFSGVHGESESDNAISIALLIMLGIEPCISFFCLGFIICYMKVYYWRYI